MRTLIVDDDFSSRRLLQKFLAPFGEFEVAVNGEEAVKAFALAWEDEHPFDLVLMDVMMPGLDGNTAVQKIREVEGRMKVGEDRKVKIIMTTALAQQKNVMEALESGASWYLVKPVSKTKLLEELKRLELIDR